MIAAQSVTPAELRDMLQAVAEPPSRNLDYFIGQWAHGPNIVHQTTSGWIISRQGTHLAPQWERYTAPDFTGNLETALTLMPKNLSWSIDYEPGQPVTAVIYLPEKEISVRAATPALAICLLRFEYESVAK